MQLASAGKLFFKDSLGFLSRAASFIQHAANVCFTGRLTFS